MRTKHLLVAIVVTTGLIGYLGKTEFFLKNSVLGAQLQPLTKEQRRAMLVKEIAKIVGEYPPTPKWKWIWSKHTGDDQVCYLQKTFTLSETPEAARLYVLCDNQFRAYLNHTLIKTKADRKARGWSVSSALVTSCLRKGMNILSIECKNLTGPGGLIGMLNMKMAGGELVQIPTDNSWRCFDAIPEGWPGLFAARELGPGGVKPWGKIGGYPVSVGPSLTKSGEEAPAPNWKWIWTGHTADNQVCYLQKSFTLDKRPQFARLYVLGDDQFQSYVNGALIAAKRDPKAVSPWSASSAIVTERLQKGENVLSMQCRNSVGPGGLVCALNMRIEGKITQIVTDASWMVFDTKPKNWPGRAESERNKFYTAHELGQGGIAPWGEIGGYPVTYRPSFDNLDPRSMIELDWITQDRKELGRSREASAAYVSMVEEQIQRTDDLLAEISVMENAPNLDEERAKLTALRSKIRAVGGVSRRRFNNVFRGGSGSGEPSYNIGGIKPTKKTTLSLLDLYLQVRWVKRAVAFKNPLLDFSQLLFIKQYYPGSLHEAAHRLNIAAIPGGGLCILNGLSPSGKGELKDVIGNQLPVGSFWRPDVSFDGKKILFCYKAPKDPAFRIYEIGLDGGGLRQMTDSPFDDLDPIYAPGGRIIFTSTRGQTYVRCTPEIRSYVLCSMNADGSNIKIISQNNEPDWTPALMEDGRILYTRWEYTDRALWRLQKLWTTNPDGTGTRVFWGNHSEKPDHLAEARQIPGTNKVVFAGVGHHQYFQGALGMIDNSKGFDYPGGLTKITPEVNWAEVEPDLDNGAYKSPFPLSEKFFIVSYGFNSNAYRPGGADFGIYLLDIFGNKELIYRDPEFNSYYAMPVKPRKTPPIVSGLSLPSASKDSNGRAVGILYNPDVYAGLEGVPRGMVKYLRIIESDYKTYSGLREYMFQCPPVSVHFVESVKRDWGVVPVEKDGSVCFKMPAGRSMYFQVLDENYMAIQTMRSFVGVQPGELRGCSGCHEGNSKTPVRYSGMALHREPSEITPPPWGNETISYERMVQPVLDRYCVKCHQENDEAKKEIDLTFRKTKFFAEPYETLIRKQIAYVYPSEPAYWGDRARDVYSVAKPLEYLSMKSPLIAIASSGEHYDVKVDDESLRRLISWIDANGPYLGLKEVKVRFPNAPVSMRP